MRVEDLTIAESFTLPSHGKIYPNSEVNEHFTLRSMTTSEEMLRMAPSEHMYENMAKVIDACMVDSPGISAYDMCVGDYQYCLYMLRTVTYGSDYKISPKCPFCGTVKECSVDLNKLPVKEYDRSLDELLTVQLPHSKDVVQLMPLTPRRLDMIQDKTRLFKKKIESNLDSSILCQVTGQVYTINNNRLNEIELENWARKLNMQDTNTLLNYSKRLNDSIGVETKLMFDCEMCYQTFEGNLVMSNEFFRPSSDF